MSVVGRGCREFQISSGVAWVPDLSHRAPPLETHVREVWNPDYIRCSPCKGLVSEFSILPAVSVCWYIWEKWRVSFQVWDGISNRCVTTFPQAHNGAEVYSVCFSKNSKVRACASEGGEGGKQDSETRGAFNQSINQSINQSTNQSSKQSIKQSINQSTNQPTNQSINQSINQSTSQPTNQSINQPTNLSINQSTNQSINQPTNQPINQSINQPINQPTNQSINQSISQSINQSILYSVYVECWSSDMAWSHYISDVVPSWVWRCYQR